MGSVKREYSLYDFELNRKTRSVVDTLKYDPIAKSCLIAMNLVHLACKELENAATARREIDCKCITQKMYNLMNEKYIKTGIVGMYQDNLPGDINFFYIPKVEGGDNYNLNCKQACDNQAFEFDVIQIAVGACYKGYYSNFVRTILINPTERIIHNYNFLLLMERAILHNLRDGVELSKVYECAMAFAENRDPYLAKYLKKEFGFALSPIFQDDLIINSKSHAVAQRGMTFSINVNLINLQEGSRIYNLCSNNTVLVQKDVQAEMFTHYQRTVSNTVIKVKDRSEL